MRLVKLLVALVIAVPAGVLLGGALTLDNSLPDWAGLLIGLSIGVFFALVFGGDYRWKVWDHVFGPADEDGNPDG